MWVSQLVCTEEGWVKVCCLRWCTFVQSGTVSVQPHPWFNLVGFRAPFCNPPAPPSGWGGRVTVSVCLRGLFSDPNWRISASDQPQAFITLNLFTLPCVPIYLSSLSLLFFFYFFLDFSVTCIWCILSLSINWKQWFMIYTYVFINQKNYDILSCCMS